MRKQTSLRLERDRLARLFALPRWALPEPVIGDVPDQQHARMFAVSHFCGPFIGLSLSGFLLLLGFPPDGRLAGFSALVCLFWLYPVALALGAPYRLLSLLSLQHLLIVIFWASQNYGGLTSPFLVWLAVVPLLAALYTAPGVRLWLALLAVLFIETGLFGAFSMFVAPPTAIAAEAQRWLALLSLLCASAYVSMMAFYLGRVLSSRNELAMEVARRRALTVALDRRATELRQLRSARVASLARLERQCREPIEEMLSGCEGETLVSSGSAERIHSDMASIKTAAHRLRNLLDSVGVHLRGSELADDRRLRKGPSSAGRN
ncbi:MAG: hypothetical protein ACK4SZ_16325 [Allosphingosinicella sp.]|uniref:hypothetical protein n=1 Tax=Allosphingosinicella sp. TaxID=2823234 RepID=UPI003931C0DA